MKKLVVIFIVIAAVSFSITYDAKVAGCAYLGSVAGAYIGGNLAAPVMILSAKIGLIDEDELFSPFSTLMYDAIDEGKVVGAVVGGIMVKYIFFERPEVANVLMDLVLSYSAAEVFKSLFGADNIFLLSGVSSLEFGVIW